MAKTFQVLDGPSNWDLLLSLMGDQKGKPDYLRPTVTFTIKIGRQHQKIQVTVNGLERLDSRGNKWRIKGMAVTDITYSPCTIEFHIKKRKGSIRIDKL